MYYFKNLVNLFLEIRVTTRDWIDNFPKGETEQRKRHPAMRGKSEVGQKWK